MRILGVDPGSRLLGYGCVEVAGNQLIHVTHGTLRLLEGDRARSLRDRLLLLYEGLAKIISKHRPEILVVENVFFAKNAVSALKLGQARGAVVLCGAIHALEIVEYSATEVKRQITGHGQSDKAQVAKMLQLLLGKQEFATLDASDGLALAVCHAQNMAGPGRFKQALPKTKLPRRKKSQTLAQAVAHRIPAHRR